MKQITQGEMNANYTNYSLLECSITGIDTGVVELQVSQDDIDRLYEFAVLGSAVMLHHNGRSFEFVSASGGVVKANAVRVI